MARSPCRTAEPETEGTVVFPDWVMLDPCGRVYCYDDPVAAAAAVNKDAIAVAVKMTIGRSGYLSFTLATPPKVSYLDLHWPYGSYEAVSPFFPAYARVLAVDKNHVLLRIDVTDRPASICPDLFVYTADHPSARRLPACTAGEPRDLAGRRSFLASLDTVGILRLVGDRDDYVLADVVVSWKQNSRGTFDYDYDNPTPMIVVLCAFSSKTGEWRVTRKLAPQPQDRSSGDFPVLWATDKVLPLDGRFLCWIDYYSGILLCDLSNDDCPVLCYMPFPGKCYDDEERVSRACPERFRSVSISQGMIFFVHIDNDWREMGQSCPTNGLTITIWTMKRMEDNWKWEVYSVISLDHLWAQHVYQVQGMPHLPPEFPIITMDDPNVLCCLLREERFGGKSWIIMVDVKDAALRSFTPYINEQTCVIDGMDVGCRSNFCNVPLLPTDFSKYLNKAPDN